MKLCVLVIDLQLSFPVTLSWAGGEWKHVFLEPHPPCRCHYRDIEYNGQYPEPQQIILYLTRRDIQWWHFEIVQHKIKVLFSGAILTSLEQQGGIAALPPAHLFARTNVYHYLTCLLSSPQAGDVKSSCTTRSLRLILAVFAKQPLFANKLGCIG